MSNNKKDEKTPVPRIHRFFLTLPSVSKLGDARCPVDTTIPIELRREAGRGGRLVVLVPAGEHGAEGRDVGQFGRGRREEMGPQRVRDLGPPGRAVDVRGVTRPRRSFRGRLKEAWPGTGRPFRHMGA